MRQLDLFADAAPADLVLPRGPLVSTDDVARAARRSRRTITGYVRETRIDAFHFVAEGGRFFVPRPAAIEFLGLEGML